MSDLDLLDHLFYDISQSFGRYMETHSLPRLAVKTAVFAGLLGIAASVITGYSSLNSRGWIPHRHVTPVWIQGDWMRGEYRICQMRTKTEPPDDKTFDSLEKLPRLFCSEDSEGLIDFQASVIPGLAFLKDQKQLLARNEVVISVTDSGLDRYFHDLPVRYWGRINRTDKLVISWRCQRNGASLTCKALN